MKHKRAADSTRRGSAKKAYRKPELTVHGDFRALTRTKGGTSNDGGGGKPNTKLGGPPG